ncbi:MAG: hypothetical protein Q9191_003199 [Dirinaria sp. TL-2023a]
MGGSTTSCTSASRSTPDQPPKKVKKQPPQKNIDDLWDAFTTKYPGKVFSVLPNNVYAETKAAKAPKGVVLGQQAGKSYDEARAECKHAVEKIAMECRRVNMKYRDAHFDIEFDLKNGIRDCLDGLARGGYDLSPKSCKRVTQIFDKPIFLEEGATASDVRQGRNGDCWFMSALCALGGKKDLIDKVCVAQDEKVGVYGFVFHRDGEWIQTIIDDKLYLTAADWDESVEEKWTWLQINRTDAEEEYRKANQAGSRALYFAQCSSENETWLPLLEKAYAKAHGDFNSIQGGFTGEAIEDLTGGVTTEIFTSDLLDTDKFWNEELMSVNDEFLFGCYTGFFDSWQGFGAWADRKDIVALHAYSILEAREVKGERLLRLRNPWGRGEWKGAWSDGSEQWTPEWMQLLNHRFGDDGMFWISYKDLLRTFQSFDRTRLFGPDWQVTQQWTSVNVPWTADYNDTKFSVTLSKSGPVVVVLSKLDDRYFQGLEGQYQFFLHFRLEKDGEQDYIVRSHGNYMMNRSVSVDLDLEAGTYSVLMKITARRYSHDSTVEEIVRENCRGRQDKLIQVGLAYDLAHAKGQIRETESEKQLRLEREEKKKAAEHQKRRKELRATWLKNWEINKKRVAREKRQAKRKEEHDRKVEARKAATAQANDNEGAASAGQVESQDAENTKKQDGNRTDAVNPDMPATTDGVPAEPNSPETKLEEQKVETETSVEEAPVQAEVGIEKQGDTTTVGEQTRSEQLQGTDAESKPDTATEEKAAQFEAALKNVPSVVINGNTPVPGTAPAAGTARPPSTAAANDNWEYDSLASFNSSIVTELDLPDPPPPDEEAAPPTAPANPDEEDDNAEFENDPWNAVCVVGLRVYSKDEGLSISVVRPKREDEEDTPLDLDDNSRGASGETIKDEEGTVKTGDAAQDKIEAEIKEGAKPESADAK